MKTRKANQFMAFIMVLVLMVAMTPLNVWAYNTQSQYFGMIDSYDSNNEVHEPNYLDNIAPHSRIFLRDHHDAFECLYCNDAIADISYDTWLDDDGDYTAINYEISQNVAELANFGHEIERLSANDQRDNFIGLITFTLNDSSMLVDGLSKTIDQGYDTAPIIKDGYFLIPIQRSCVPMHSRFLFSKIQFVSSFTNCPSPVAVNCTSD